MAQVAEKEVVVKKSDFLAFENIRRSGVTNMFDRATVMELSGISKEVYMNIISGDNYSKYADKWLKEGK